jgi:hypothetical protein
MYQQMLESVQQTIVRRLFLVVRPAGQSSARRPDLTAQHPQSAGHWEVLKPLRSRSPRPTAEHAS